MNTRTPYASKFTKKQLKEIAFSSKYATRGFARLIRAIGKKIHISFVISFSSEVFRTRKNHGANTYGLRVYETTNTTRMWRFNWQNPAGGELTSVDIAQGSRTWINIDLKGKDVAEIVKTIQSYLNGDHSVATKGEEGTVVSIGGTKVHNQDLSDELNEANHINMTLQEQFEEVEDIIKTVATGGVYCAILLGGGGIGKSTVVEETLESLGLHKGTDWFLLKGYTTSTYLYTFLYDHSDKIVVFDDCDEAFQDKTSAAILKAALDSKRVRDVSYGTSRPPAGYETEFVCTAKAIFISNLGLKDFPGALVSRASGSVAELDYTHDDLVKYIRALTPKLLPEFTDKEFKTEVIEYILQESSTYKIAPLPRFVVNLLNISITNPTNYKKRVTNAFRLQKKATMSTRTRG